MLIQTSNRIAESVRRARAHHLRVVGRSPRCLTDTARVRKLLDDDDQMVQGAMSSMRSLNVCKASRPFDVGIIMHSLAAPFLGRQTPQNSSCVP